MQNSPVRCRNQLVAAVDNMWEKVWNKDVAYFVGGCMDEQQCRNVKTRLSASILQNAHYRKGNIDVDAFAMNGGRYTHSHGRIFNVSCWDGAGPAKTRATVKSRQASDG